jgi:hypothetical protein
VPLPLNSVSISNLPERTQSEAVIASDCRFLEARVARVINFDRGSKKRMQRIRWTPCEKAAFILLFLSLGVFCVLIGLWDASSYAVDPTVSGANLR